MAVSKLVKWTMVGALLLLVLPLVLGACAPPQVAEKPEDFFKDKTIKLITRGSPGSGTDMISRLVATYLKEYLGARAVPVENNEEAAGIVLANLIWDAPPDGLTLGTIIMHSLVISEVAHDPGVKYESDKYNVLVGLTSEIGEAMVVNAKGPYKSIADLQRAKGLKFAGPAGKCLRAALAIDILGLDAKVIPGVQTADAQLGLQRGEIDFFTDTPGGTATRVKEGQYLPLCWILTKPHPVVMSDLPGIGQLAKLSSQQQEWLKLTDYEDAGKYIVTSPKVPKDRVEYLRGVFEKINRDPRFIEERRTKYQRWPPEAPEPWLTGAEAQRLQNEFKQIGLKGHAPMEEYLSQKYYTVK